MSMVCHHWGLGRPSVLVFEPRPVGWRGGGVYYVHGRSRMSMDRRVPTMPGRRTSGFH